MKTRIAFVLTWKRIAAGAAGILALAFAVGFSGLVPIRASSGHFAPWGWFLHWTMQNAADHQSLFVRVPEDMDLSDPMLVQRAAGHFATGCAPCHGAPGVPRSPVVLSMTPHPPRLEETVREYEDRELFWIVKHGIKYTGMPAWPAQMRDDEVWAQVAFLRALPGLSRERYGELALGVGSERQELQAGGETLAAMDGIFEEALTDCARCHGRDGLGRGEGPAANAFPVIAGQPAPYLAATLKAFSRGLRHSGFMQPPARRYSDAVLDRLAQWYSEQPAGPQTPPTSAAPASGQQTADGIPAQILPVEARGGNLVPVSAAAGGAPSQREALLALGRLVAESGIPARKIPACESCHGRGGRTKNEHYPYLAGQPAWYTETHLHLWKEGTRGGTGYSHLMRPIAEQMTDEQIAAVAAWYAERPTGE
ncbi:c-type cytochrome [Aurantimonas sp. VKM B-3413]|uniref:c-type cytochrome n=1 Tax=Aurantimonas sp. VKM B-3413 TaxID=2779401 RepID=UPI001E596310|nr:c-type cytochrome [Aurantimonas sp. VKM B-3413]MCB8837956.1 c-type cytochrome [Aurantimonas sp. VKM B-3413]